MTSYVWKEVCFVFQKGTDIQTQKRTYAASKHKEPRMRKLTRMLVHALCGNDINFSNLKFE